MIAHGNSYDVLLNLYTLLAKNRRCERLQRTTFDRKAEKDGNANFEENSDAWKETPGGSSRTRLYSSPNN